MKKIILFISLAISSCAPSYAAYLSDSTKAQILHAVAVLQEDNKVVRQNLHDANEALAASEAETKAVQVAADKLKGERDWYRDDDAKKDSVIADKDKVIAAKNHKLNLLGLALAFVCSALAFQLLGLLTPVLTPAMAVYSTAGRLGVSALVFAAVFSWVRYF
jgi:hypothetical protein